MQISGAYTGSGKVRLEASSNSNIAISGDNRAFEGEWIINTASGSVIQSGDGTNSGTGLGGGTVTVETGTINILNTQTIKNLSSGSGTGAATAITGGASALTIEMTDDVSNTYYGTISGELSVEKSGAGTLILSGANTYTGATTVSAGVLKISGSLASSSNIDIDADGTLELASDVYTQSVPFSNKISGTGTILNKEKSKIGVSSDISGFSGTFDIQNDIYFMQSMNGSNASLNVSSGKIVKACADSVITLKSVSGTGFLAHNWANSTATYQIGSGNFSGVIGYNAGDADQQKYMSQVKLEKISDGTSDGGTLTLSGTNTYSGGTEIKQGRLIATQLGALGSGNIVNNSELELNLTASGTFSKDLTGTGSLTVQSGDANTLTLTSANIQLGELRVDKAAVELADGGRMQLNGDVTLANAGAFHVGAGGKLVLGPETAATGTKVKVNADGGTFDVDGTLEFDVFAPDVYGSLEIASGTVDLSGASISLVLPEDKSAFYNHIVMLDVLVGNVTGLNSAAIRLSDSDLRAVFRGNQIAIGSPADLPEPSTWALLLLGALGLFWTKHRTRKEFHP